MKTSHFNNLRLTLSADITVTSAPVSVRVSEDLSDATGNGLESLITSTRPMYLTIARALNGVEQDDREIVFVDGVSYNSGAGEWELNVTGRGQQQDSGGNAAKTWTVATEVPYLESRLTVDDYDLKADLDAPVFINLAEAPQVKSPIYTVPYAASIALSFAENDNKKLTLTGNVTFTTASSGRAAGRGMDVLIEAGAASRTLTFPSGWRFIGIKPASIPASKVAILSLRAYGPNETDIIAVWGEQL